MHEVESDMHARHRDGERFELKQVSPDDLHVPAEAFGEDLGPTRDAPDPTPLPYEPVKQPPPDIAGRTGQENGPWLGGSRRDADLDWLLPSAEPSCHCGSHAAPAASLASAASPRRKLARRMATESLSASSQASSSSAPT